MLVAEQLRNTKMWVGPCVDILTGPEALTCAVLTKYNILRQIQEENIKKIKKLLEKMVEDSRGFSSHGYKPPKTAKEEWVICDLAAAFYKDKWA